VDEVRDGKGIIRLKGTNGTMDLQGKIAIQNKQGIWKERSWSKKVTVMKPSGSIELPEFNILYRGYNNQVNATASGYPNTKLSGTNVTIRNNGDGYYVSPGNGRTATLVVSGTTATGKTVQLKRISFNVRRMPSAELFWGGQENGGRINGSNLLIAKFGDGIPLNAKFDVLSWSAKATGMRTAPLQGQGSNIASLRRIVSLLQVGDQVVIEAKVKRPDGIIETRVGVWTK
jgi:hypothetical protein